MKTDDLREIPHSPATLRGAQSFFADTVHGSRKGRVCRGLSCHLAKAVDRAKDDAGLQPVYCLGYCDQSPAWMRPENQVVVGAAKTSLVSRRVTPGTLFLPFHFPESQTNVLTGPHLDPQSKCPEYKLTAVRIRAASISARKAGFIWQADG